MLFRSGRWRVPGRTRVGEFRREYPELGEVAQIDTMGGLLVSLLEVVPAAGESAGLVEDVDEVARTRIGRNLAEHPRKDRWLEREELQLGPRTRPGGAVDGRRTGGRNRRREFGSLIHAKGAAVRQWSRKEGPAADSRPRESRKNAAQATRSTMSGGGVGRLGARR